MILPRIVTICHIPKGLSDKFKIHNIELDKLLQNGIEEIINYHYTNLSEEYNLFLWIVFHKDTESICIKRGGVSKKEKYIEFGVWLPVQEFYTSSFEDHQMIYINLFFDGIVELFKARTLLGKKINIPESSIRDIQKEVVGIVLTEKEKYETAFLP
jgi:hypothetical protein